MTSRFEVGQLVKARAFVDSFGKEHAEVPNLIVTGLREMRSTPSDLAFKAYVRVTAEAFEPHAKVSLIEGHEHFFLAMNPSHLATVLS